MREILDLVLCNNCNCGKDDTMSPEKHSEYCGFRLIAEKFAAQKTRIAELEAKVQELEAAQRWIPVSEGLPDSNTPVLLKIKGVVQHETWVLHTSSDNGMKWFWPYGDDEGEYSLEVSEVSSWMPLPTPPEVEQ